MKKKIVILPLLIILIISNGNYSYANSIKECGDIESEEPMTIEELYKAMCFIDMDEAIEQFEKNLIQKYTYPKVYLLKPNLDLGRLRATNFI